MTFEPDKQRLHPAGVLVMILSRAREMVLLAVLALFGSDSAEGVPWLYVAGIPVVVLLGIVRWYRFRYWIEGDEFRVEDGAIIRKRAFIPLDKVQAVDISAGLVQRLLGVVKLEVKTGAAGTQAELTTVTTAEAERLRALLRPDAGHEASPELETAPDEGYSLSTKELLLAGATSGQLAVVGAMVGWVLSRFEDTLVAFAVDQVKSHAAGEALAHGSPAVVAALVAVGLSVAWLIATLWSAAKFGRFSLARRGPNLVVTRGLVETQQITLPIDRVQAVRFHETLVRQPLGYGTLYVETVGHAEAEGQATVLHPFLHRDALAPLLADLLPQFDVKVDFVRPPPRALPRFLVAPTLVVLGVVAIAALALSPWALLGLGALPLLWLLGYVGWRDGGLSLGETVAVVRSRGLRRTTAFVRRSTAQLTQTTASLLQRRRDLATVRLTVATGVAGRTFSARDLDAADAWRAMQWTLAARGA